jgi:hypothetical protein
MIFYQDAVYEYFLDEKMAEVMLDSLRSEDRTCVRGEKKIHIPYMPEAEVVDKKVRLRGGHLVVSLSVVNDGDGKSTFSTEIKIPPKVRPLFFDAFPIFAKGLKTLSLGYPLLEKMSKKQIEMEINSFLVAYYRSLSRGILKRVLRETTP